MHEPMRCTSAWLRPVGCSLSMRMNPDLAHSVHARTVVMGQAFPDSFAHWFEALTRDLEARDPVESMASTHLEPHASAAPARPPAQGAPVLVPARRPTPHVAPALYV